MAFYNYEQFAMREESVLCFHRKAPPPVEHHTIIEDCHSMVYTSPNMAAPRNEHGNWPKKTVTTTAASVTRPPLPLRVITSTEAAKFYGGYLVTEYGPSQMKKPVITSTEAAKLYGGYLVTEPRKPSRPY